MKRLGIRWEEIEESFIRSGGSGGQNVNKVSTCVVMRHLPTGTEVRCQRERSQGLNRFLALRALVDRIEAARLGAASMERQRIEKIRRQKRKRSRRAKDKMLEGKRHRSEIKSQRAQPRGGWD
ncbi:MAG: Peptide chain release factor 1 [Candidatus Omnitrophica bacterium]|nr:Peptide chain release factor 1 [Candidatus Omnitrophota bacterium]